MWQHGATDSMGPRMRGRTHFHQHTIMPTSNASATWEGTLKGGKGSFKGKSGAIQGAYSFATRFEGTAGTNPEELLAAAEAACFSMALSMGLEGAGVKPEHIETQAACTIDKAGAGFRITTMKLQTRVKASGLDAAKLEEVAEATKKACPVSVALSGVEITVDAQLA